MFQIIDPLSFKICVCNSKKRNVPYNNYFNLGFFDKTTYGKLIPVGNLVDNGNIISQTSGGCIWKDIYNNKISTLCIHYDGSFEIQKISDFHNTDIKTAVSGIPVIHNGVIVKKQDALTEGYSCNNLYYTWHGFICITKENTIADAPLLIYIAKKCKIDFIHNPFPSYIKDAIKIDGGSSFIYKLNNKIIKSTFGNTPINNVGVF